MARKPKPLTASAYCLLKALAKHQAIPIDLQNIVEGGELAKRKFATLATPHALKITKEGQQHLKETSK